jgi:Transposase DDE domain
VNKIWDTRLENEDALDRMAERVAARPDLLDRRREIVEHPFGSIKQWMNQGAFVMRGLENVRAEFSLTALVYNSAAGAQYSWRPQIVGGRGRVKRSPEPAGTGPASGMFARRQRLLAVAPSPHPVDRHALSFEGLGQASADHKVVFDQENAHNELARV